MKKGFCDRRADREQAVVTQDQPLLGAEIRDQSVLFVGVERKALVIVIGDGTATIAIPTSETALGSAKFRRAVEPVNLRGCGLAVCRAAPYVFLMAYGLTIVVPTLNEAGNIEPLVDRLAAALPDSAWEVVFVDDDSTDGTADVVRRVSRQRDNVRLILRVGRRGLATAAIEGMLSSSAPVLAVMDGDLQHDASVLSGMLARLTEGDLEIVVASRFAGGSRVDGLSEPRKVLSRVGNSIGRRVARAELTDPLTGFSCFTSHCLTKLSMT